MEKKKYFSLHSCIFCLDLIAIFLLVWSQNCFIFRFTGNTIHWYLIIYFNNDRLIVVYIPFKFVNKLSARRPNDRIFVCSFWFSSAYSAFQHCINQWDEIEWHDLPFEHWSVLWQQWHNNRTFILFFFRSDFA